MSALRDAGYTGPRTRGRYGGVEDSGERVSRKSVGEIAGHILMGVGALLVYWYGRDRSGSGGDSRW